MVVVVAVSLVLVLRPTGGGSSGTGEQPGAAAPSSPSSGSSVRAAWDGAATGVFRDNDPAETAAYGDWLGAPVQVATVFPARGTWAEVSDPSYLLDAWRSAPQRLSVAVALLPTDDDSATVEQGATGAYDEHFAELGRNLVAEGQQDAVLRVGWEFNLPGSRWASDDPAAWRTYFRRVVAALRSAPGQQFQVDWNVNDGDGSPQDPVEYYPGDDVVDYVGVDAYDQSGSAYPVPDGCTGSCAQQAHERAWQQSVYGGRRGLEFWSGFAAQHGKLVSLPEWGLWDRPDGTGGGDDPYYVRQVHAFVADRANAVGYESYFEVDDQGQHRLMTGFPRSAAVFRQLFG